MIRWLLLFLLISCNSVAHAHFVFVVPDLNRSEADIIMSETLVPEDAVSVEIIRQTKLSMKTGDTVKPLELTKSDANTYKTSIIGRGNRLISGTTDLGIMERGSKPYWLMYYPKTIIGDPVDPASRVKDAPVEIIAVGGRGEYRLQVLIQGKPAANTEMTLVSNKTEDKVVKLDAQGRTDPLSPGRYGAWARYWENKPGEKNGKKYEEIRHYATLVVDIPGEMTTNAQKFINLPEATSSHGAVGLDGWLYVYGGHISPTHEYHTEAVSGKFHRINMADPQKWEKLESGPAQQGMNIAVHNGKIYRIGGMQPQNKKGEKYQNYSQTSNAVYDPSTGKWTAIADLPEPRSSHDVAVIGDTLYVVGGWNLQGADKTEWVDTYLTMDLSQKSPKWVSHKQPFVKRALIAAVHQGKLYVIGGFDDQDTPSLEVEIFDPVSKSWSKGPSLPGVAINGFSPAACVLNGELYVSVFDGSFLKLDDKAGTWTEIAKTTPRVVHRLVPNADHILVIGGAAKGDNLDLIEVVNIGNGAGLSETAKAPTEAVQTVCPVMHGVPIDSAISADYKGKTVYFCCQGCKAKFTANPEKYLDTKILPQLAEM